MIFETKKVQKDFLQMAKAQKRKIIDILSQKDGELESLFFIYFWDEVENNLQKYVKEKIMEEKRIIKNADYVFLKVWFWNEYHCGYQFINEAVEIREILLKKNSIKIDLESILETLYGRSCWDRDIKLYLEGKIIDAFPKSVKGIKLKEEGIRKWIREEGDMFKGRYHFLWYMLMDLYPEKVNPLEIDEIYCLEDVPDLFLKKIKELKSKKNAKDFMEYFG